MRQVKSERLKKLETELNDLEQWLKLGLVPKKDLEKHKEEIVATRAKMDEELERLRFLKESGEIEEYTAPKRGQSRGGYTDMPTIPDLDIHETNTNINDSEYDMESENSTSESTTSDTEREKDTESDNTYNETIADEDSYFSRKNRWRRIVDPDADDW